LQIVHQYGRRKEIMREAVEILAGFSKISTASRIKETKKAVSY
jgi:hypothetical protein